MKRPHVFGLFATVTLLVMIVGLAFAEGGKAQGQPFQYLQQQIDELRAQIAVQPNIKGCWAVTAIHTQTGGSAPTTTGMPPQGVYPPVLIYTPPFYWNSGRKIWNQAYLKVDFQSGTQIRGKYYSWIGNICLYQNGDSIPGCIPGQFYGFPFEGYVIGNLLQLYTSTTDSPYNHKEEQRYFNGILTEDSDGRKIIHGMAITSRDMAGGIESHSWTNIVFSFTSEPYEGSCDDLPPPNLGDMSFSSSAPYWGWYQPPSP